VSADKYGSRYWCVKTRLSEDGEIYLFADKVTVADGMLIFTSGGEDGAANLNLALAPGEWGTVFAASIIDGCAVAVEHWRGEVAE